MIHELFMKGVDALTDLPHGIFNVPLDHLLQWFQEVCPEQEGVSIDLLRTLAKQEHANRRVVLRTQPVMGRDVEFVHFPLSQSVANLQNVVRAAPPAAVLTIGGRSRPSSQWTVESLTLLCQLRNEIRVSGELMRKHPANTFKPADTRPVTYSEVPPEYLVRELLQNGPVESNTFSRQMVARGFSRTGIERIVRFERKQWRIGGKTISTSFVHLSVSEEQASPLTRSATELPSVASSSLGGDIIGPSSSSSSSEDADDTSDNDHSDNESLSLPEEEEDRSGEDEPCGSSPLRDCPQAERLWALSAVAATTTPTATPSLYTMIAAVQQDQEEEESRDQKGHLHSLPLDEGETSYDDVQRLAFQLSRAFEAPVRLVLINALARVHCDAQRLLQRHRSRRSVHRLRTQQLLSCSSEGSSTQRNEMWERYCVISLAGRRYCWHLVQSLLHSPHYRTLSTGALIALVHVLHHAAPWSEWQSQTEVGPVVCADALNAFFATENNEEVAAGGGDLPASNRNGFTGKVKALQQTAVEFSQFVAAAVARYKSHPSLSQFATCSRENDATNAMMPAEQHEWALRSFGYDPACASYRKAAAVLSRIGNCMAWSEVLAVDTLLREERRLSNLRWQQSFEMDSS